MPVNPDTRHPTKASRNLARKRERQKTKVKRGKAHRTPTEIGQYVPESPSGEALKGVALKATRKGRKGLARAALATDLVAGPSVAEANKKTRKLVRRKKRAQREARRAAKALKRSADLMESNERAMKRTLSERQRREAVVPQSTFDTVADKAEDVLRHGAAPELGLVSRKTAGDVREATYGSRNPSALDVALAVAPVPAFKGASAVRAILRGQKVLRTGARAAKAAKTAKGLKTARKAERAAARKAAAKASRKPARRTRATGKQMGKQARKRLSKAEAAAAAKRSATRASDRAVRSATSPTVAALSASPGEVGERTRAFVEGTAKANVPKSAMRTAEAAPALFTYGATLGAAAGTAAVTGDTDPLKAAVKQGAEGMKAIAPLFSGDAEKVKEATENTVGYAFAPLLPRGSVSTPARAAARGAGRGARAVGKVGKAARKVVPKKTVHKAQPGAVRHAKQVVAGTPARKRIAVIGGRTMEAEAATAHRSQRAIEKHAAKLGRRHGPEAESLAVVAVDHGLGPKNTTGQLRAILGRRLNQVDDPLIPNERKAVEWGLEHPEVFDDPSFWRTVEEAKRQTSATETSRSAKYVSQGEVAGVIPRQERVPAAAREFTDANTRTEAWADHADLKRRIADKKGALRKTEESALTNPDMRQRILTQRAEIKAMEYRAQRLQKELAPYTRPGQSLNGKRKPWDKQMQEEFVRDVQKERHPDATEPGWTSHRADDDLVGSMGGPRVQSAGPRVSRVRGGKAVQADIVDRSLPAFLANSIARPRIQRGVNEFIRRVYREFGEKVPGTNRTVVSSTAEANRLVREGVVDPREYVFVPVRHVKQAAKAEKFDLAGYHTQIIDDLNAEVGMLENRPGTKYTLMRRENAEEFSHQLNPNVDEGVLGKTSTAGSRLILGTNPAWLEAQFVNELTQSAVAVNPLRTLHARQTLYRFGRDNPIARDRFRALAGDSPASLETAAATGKRYATSQADAFEAYRFSRKTPGGKALSDIGHLRTLGKIDRWKSGEIRSATLAAHIDREINGLPARARGRTRAFFKGLAGVQDLEFQMAERLRKMDPQEQLRAWTEDPEFRALQEKHLNYLDDVLGNWKAFTRFEKRYSPVTMFYPYLRMSMRWTFWSYPRHHPIKASILYLLAQQNREEVSKIIGHEASFLEGAVPVVYGKEGEAAAVLPGGIRFGAPGSNAILEAIGAENVAGLTRALNPAIQAALAAGLGIDAYTGKGAEFSGDLGQQLLQRAVQVARQVVSLPGPLRVTVGRGIGKEQNPAGKKFQSLDPLKDLRSILFPFLPQDAEDFAKQSKLSRSFRKTDQGVKSEVGQLYAMVDALGFEEAEKRIRQQARAAKYQEKTIKYPKDNDPRMQRLIDLYYKIKYGGGSSETTDYQKVFGGGKSGGGGSKPTDLQKTLGGGGRSGRFGGGGKPTDFQKVFGG